MCNYKNSLVFFDAAFIDFLQIFLQILLQIMLRIGLDDFERTWNFPLCISLC